MFLTQQSIQAGELASQTLPTARAEAYDYLEGARSLETLAARFDG